MKGEYVALRNLQLSDGYKVLQALWAHQHGKIVEAMRKAGKRNTESSWRYYAGQQEGFELAITQLERGLEALQKDIENGVQESEGSKDVEELLNNLRDKKNGA